MKTNLFAKTNSKYFQIQREDANEVFYLHKNPNQMRAKNKIPNKVRD